MDNSFRSGFEKTALLGSIIGKATKFALSKMPKIFKGLTYSKGKFSLGKSVTSGFVGMEAADVAKKTSQQVNERQLVNTFR